MKPIALLLGAAVLGAVALVSALAEAPGPRTSPSAPTASAFKEIAWDALVPQEWDPLKPYRAMNLDLLNDSNPEVLQMMRNMRATWDNAPTVAAMDGAAVKLPGYVVPLEDVNGALKEFLLVPYFGACVHTPPPPANQIIHVVAGKPVTGFRSMDTVWVSGTLKTQRQDSSMGVSGYQMDAVHVDGYVPPAQR